MTILMLMITGKMLKIRQMACLVWIGGEMLALRNENECLPYLRNPGFLL
jgi:hypothetical protein